MSGTLSGFASGAETQLFGIGSGEAAQPPTADVLVNSFSSVMIDENPTARLFGAVRRGMADQQAFTGRSGERFLTAEEANQQYGIPGVLTFSAGLAESSAVALQERARDRVAREDISSRAQSGVVGWTARGAISLAAAALDPLSVASAFVPVVGEVRAAAWLGGATTRLGRVGAAMRIGAIEGVAGAAMLEPLNIGLASSEARQDYGMADSLLNVAFGAGFGALLHGAGRGVIDGFRGWAPDGRLANETHESAVRAAVAQVQRGDPVDVRPVFDAGRAAAPEVTPASAPPAAAPLFRDADPAAPVALPMREDGAPLTRQEFEARLEQARAAVAEPGATVAEPGLRAAGPVETLDPSTNVRLNTPAGSADARVAASQDVPPHPAAPPAAGEASTPLAASPAAAPHAAEVDAAYRWYTDAIEAQREAEGANPDAAIRATVEQAARPAVRPEDAIAVAQAEAARTRSEAGARVETPVARTTAATARLDAQIAETDRVLTEMVRTGRITEAEAQAVRAPEAEALTAERVKGIEAAAACMIANGA